jgi:hypothetical protein
MRDQYQSETVAVHDPHGPLPQLAPICHCGPPVLAPSLASSVCSPLVRPERQLLVALVPYWLPRGETVAKVRGHEIVGSWHVHVTLTLPLWPSGPSVVAPLVTVNVALKGPAALPEYAPSTCQDGRAAEWVGVGCA